MQYGLVYGIVCCKVRCGFGVLYGMVWCVWYGMICCLVWDGIGWDSVLGCVVVLYAGMRWYSVVWYGVTFCIYNGMLRNYMAVICCSNGIVFTSNVSLQHLKTSLNVLL